MSDKLLQEIGLKSYLNIRPSPIPDYHSGTYCLSGGWIDRNILEIGRGMRLSFLQPLMVYRAVPGPGAGSS